MGLRLAQGEFGSGTLGDGFSLGGGDGEILRGDVGVANGQTTVGAEVDVAEGDTGDGSLRETDDGSGGLATGGRDVLNRDVVEVRGEAGDGGRGYLSGGEDLGVVLADDESVFDVLHVDVAEGDVADVGSAVAVGFDANAVVGSVEVNALSEDVLRSSGDFAADRDAVAVEEGAIGDGDVAAGFVGAGRIGGTGLDGDVVVADVHEDVADGDVGGGEGIDAVGIDGAEGGENLDVADDDVVRVVGDDLPHGRVLDGDSVHEDVLAVVEDDEAGTRVVRPHDAMILDGAGLQPPAFTVAIDDSLSSDGEIGGVGGADEGLVAGSAELGDFGIVGVIGGAEEGGSLVEMEIDVAFEDDGGADVGSGGEKDSASSFGCAGVNCGLNRVSILGNAVGFGTVGTDVAGGGGKGADGRGGEGEAEEQGQGREAGMGQKGSSGARSWRIDVSKSAKHRGSCGWAHWSDHFGDGNSVPFWRESCQGGSGRDGDGMNEYAMGRAIGPRFVGPVYRGLRPRL